MKILWLTNVPLPEASVLMKETPCPFGGWLINASEYLAKQPGIEISIAFPKKGIKKYIKLIGAKINYYAFEPVKDNDKNLIENNQVFKNMLNEIEPDIVHIHGTEMAHTLSMVNMAKINKIRTVISIQGLVSVISKHMYADLPFKVIYGATLRNILRKDNVRGLKNLYCIRGKNENRSIQNVKHIIGRTTWDRSCTTQINANAKYYACNETLRVEFYKHEWDIEKCEKHSIFMSQGQYPIKGLHYVLEAMPIILKYYPNVKLYVGGKNITKYETLLDKMVITYYGLYIRKLIKKYGLENIVIFTGPLNEMQMCERFLKSNVFVSASTIENESNSLSEARILGVPSIASFVGGVTDRINHGSDGFLYQHNAPYMLSYYVCYMFKNENVALEFSEKARERALKMHNIEDNNNNLMQIYKKILE